MSRERLSRVPEEEAQLHTSYDGQDNYSQTNRSPPSSPSVQPLAPATAVDRWTQPQTQDSSYATIIHPVVMQMNQGLPYRGQQPALSGYQLPGMQAPYAMY
mmetsp:Transcript_42102/g.69769  ORF Transcript_42102/g.69769 Transcript_42102/m.69769 type:complete len:101 (+) Transcript_42102:3-305(+)